MKKKMLKNIVASVSMGALALSIGGCEMPDNTEYIQRTKLINDQMDRLRPINEEYGIGAVETQLAYETRKISGEILSIDEDSFPIGGGGGGGGLWATQFPYENIRIRDEEGKERRFVIPQLSDYAVGDRVSGEYMVLSNCEISFAEFSGMFSNAVNQSKTFLLQEGKIKAEGILKY